MDKGILFSVEQVSFPKVHIAANSDYNTKAPTGEAEYIVRNRLMYNRDEKLLHASMAFELSSDQETNQPYSIEIFCYSVFAVNFDLQDLPDDIREEILKDIHIILFGGVREMVAMVTSRSPWGVFHVQILSPEKTAERLWDSFEAVNQNDEQT